VPRRLLIESPFKQRSSKCNDTALEITNPTQTPVTVARSGSNGECRLKNGVNYAPGTGQP